MDELDEALVKRGDSTKRPVSSMFYFVKAAVAP